MLLNLLFFSAVAWADQNALPICVRELTKIASVEKSNAQAIAQILPLLNELDVPEWPEIRNAAYPGQEGKLILAGADFNSWMIFISFDYFILAEPIFGPHAYKVGLQHELGHMVFMANMARYISSWGRYYRAASSSGAFGRFVRVWSLAPRPVEVDSISMPYQEVFADLLPVLASDEPDVVAETVRHLGQRKFSEARSFCFEGETCPSRANDRHDAFEKIRKLLWFNYFEKPKNKEYKAKMVAIVFDVMAREMVERIKNPNLHEISPAEMMSRLQRKLEIALVHYR